MRYLLFAALVGASFPISDAAAQTRVGVAPVQGSAKYPLVMSGLRQVLVSDLEDSGSFTVENVNVEATDLSPSGIGNISQKTSVDVILTMRVAESPPRFTVTFRAYNVSTGYNLGSRSVTGQYSEIKNAQDRSFEAAMALLQAPVNDQLRSRVSKLHSNEMGAVQELGRADVALQQQNYAAAVEGFSKARAQDPSFGIASKRLEKSVQFVQRIGDAAKAGEAYSHLGDSEKAMEAFNRALNQNAGNADALIGKARLLVQLNRAREAIPLFERATQIDARNPYAHIGLGTAYEALGQQAAATRAYETAREYGATDPTVYESLGRLYAKSGQKKPAAEAYSVAGEMSERAVYIAQAQRYFNQANHLSPSPAILERQADLFLQNGQIDLAVLNLTKALMLAPSRDTLESKLGYALYLDNQWSQAEQHLKRAYDLNPSNFQANYYLGLIYIEDRDRRGQALKYLETAVRLQPGHSEAQWHLARLYLSGNNPNAAITLLEKLAQANPRDAETMKRLGDAYLAADDGEGAKRSYLRAIELRPDYLDAHESLVSAYLKLKDREGAIEQIRRVYQIDAENNIFVKGAGDLVFSTFGNADLVYLIRTFPKVVSGASGPASINQVSLTRLREAPSWTDWKYVYDTFFKLYTLDETRIVQDIEFALFARYRAVSADRTGAPTMPPAEYSNTASLDSLLVRTEIDGLFGLEIIDRQSSGESTQITIGLSLYSLFDHQYTRVDDLSIIPKLTYSSREVLSLNRKAPIAYALTLGLLFFPMLYLTFVRGRKRGRGTIRVIINYDPKHESFLTLKLSKKKEKERDTHSFVVRDRDKYEKQKYKRLLRQKGAWVRNMVGKTTLFENVPVRSYFCYLYGTIEDVALAKKTVGNYFMVQKVTVEKNKTSEITFQLEKDEAFITVFVRMGDADITGAEIRVEGDPEPKYSRGEAGAFIYLGRGRHTLRITHNGRTIEHVVNVYDDLSDQIINIDMQSVEDAELGKYSDSDLSEVADKFQEQGRLDDAAQLYEKAGAAEKASEVRAEAALQSGNVESAAQELVRARQFWRAAELYQSAGENAKANYCFGLHYFGENDLENALKYMEKSENYPMLAKIYEKLGDKKKAQRATADGYVKKGQKIEAAQLYVQLEEYGKAADLYESMGDASKAAVLHAKDGNYQIAGELFAQVGEQQKAALAFEKGGLYEQAIPIFRELGDIPRVIELYTRDERYLEAAKLYQEQGMVDEAIALCQKVPSFHVDKARTQEVLANLFAEKGMEELAIKTFGDIKQEGAHELENDSEYRYASLLEKSGSFEKALEIFEELLKKDFHFKDVGTKVDEVRKKVSAQKARSTMTGSQNIGATIAGGQTVTPKSNRYELQEELGRGAMGIVYKARDAMLDRIVALKTLPHTLQNDPEALDQLMKEAQTAAKLNHPNIVTVFDVGQENGNYFIAMEYVQGKTLQQVLKQVKKVGVRDFSHIAQALCGVIGYAHSQRVIHRDIKPSNILLLPSRTVKLMDFGLAKVLQDMAIDKTMLRGTPLYMSPEQVVGKDIDHRADLYALGIIFYEMLSGAPPFTQGDIMYAHIHTPPPPLKDRVNGISETIIDTVMRCLEKNKANRPESAEALLKSMQL